MAEEELKREQMKKAIEDQHLQKELHMMEQANIQEEIQNILNTI